MFSFFGIVTYSIINIWILLINMSNILFYYKDFIKCDNNIKITMNSKKYILLYVILHFLIILFLIIYYINHWIKINRIIYKMYNIDVENINNYLKIELNNYIILYNFKEFTCKLCIIIISIIGILEYNVIFFQSKITLNNSCDHYYTDYNLTSQIFIINLIVSIISIVIIISYFRYECYFLNIINNILNELKYNIIDDFVMDEIIENYNRIYNTNYNINNLFISVINS